MGETLPFGKFDVLRMTFVYQIALGIEDDSISSSAFACRTRHGYLFPVRRYVLDNYNVNLPLNDAVVCAFFASLWGITVGVMRKSLGSALCGLNTGAVLGYSFGAFTKGRTGTFIRDTEAVALCLLCAALLGMAININREGFFKSAILGGLADVVSETVMYASVVVVFFIGDYIHLDWLFIPLICIVPWTAGLGVFVWLLVDVLPKKYASKPAMQNDP